MVEPYGDRFAAFRTVDDAARTAAAMLAGGESLSRIWRFALAQMLDDYDSVLRNEGVDAARRMWHELPQPTGDARVDAALTAMAEYLARRDGWSPARWVSESIEPAEPWWFVTELRGMHARGLVESPSSFRRRGVFITRDALERL